MQQDCLSKCPLDCRHTSYFLRQQLSQRVSRTLLQVIRDRGTYTRMTATARTTLLDMITVMLNSASFWYSLSPLAVLLSLKLLNCSRRRRLRRRQRQRQVKGMQSRTTHTLPRNSR